MKIQHGTVVLAGLLALAARAEADAPPPAPKRPVPSYDGRAPEAPPNPLIWVPRVLLFPPYLVSEYLLRRPLGWAVQSAEKGGMAEPNPRGKNGFAPTFLVDAGQRTQFGLVYVRSDFPDEHDALRVHAAFGGLDWQRLLVSERVALDPRSSVAFRLEGWRRSDGVFYGIGPKTVASDQSFYGTHVARGGLAFDGGVGALGLGAHMRVEGARFDADPSSGPTLGARTAEGRLAHPPGFDEGIGVFAEGLSVSLASPDAAEGTGERVEAHAEHAVGFVGVPDRWVRYGAAATGSLDVTGHHRVVRLTLEAELADPLAGTVPFTELVALGGDGPMRGFLGGRVRDRSAGAVTLEYTWPIWALLDGAAHVALGNGFGTHFEDLGPDLLRLSFGGGFRLHGARDIGFELLVASGTETFGEGAAPEGVRVVFGIAPKF